MNRKHSLISVRKAQQEAIDTLYIYFICGYNIIGT